MKIDGGWLVTGHWQNSKVDKTYWQNGQVTNVERIVVRRLAVDQPAGGDQTCKDQLQKCFLGSNKYLILESKKAYSAILPKSTIVGR